MVVENSFGSMLATARRRIGWKQQELADKFYDKFTEPVSRVTVNRWEQDIQRPPAYRLEQLISILALNEKEADAFRHAAGQPGQPPPEIFEVPYLRNRFFTGREAYLKDLCQFLQKDGIVGISGLAGLGKTQIALEYAYCFHPDVYRTVLWVNAADTATLQADFAALAETLKLPERDEQKLEPRIKAVKNWLKEHTNWLLVMDNADELPIVRQFLPSKLLGHIVLTTRWQFPGKFARPLAIEAMEPEEGLLFLWRRSRPVQDDAEVDAVPPAIREAGRQLVEELGGHALALEQAGAYLQETGISFVGYLKLYEENRRSLLDQYGSLDEENSDHPLTVAATFKMSFARARELSPLAEDILHFCAFLYPDSIAEELFQHDENFKLDTMALNKGVAALLRYSLMKRNTQEQTLSIHRLVQAVVTDAMSTSLQKQWRDHVVRTLNVTFPASEFNNWRQCERLVSHVLACAAWANEITPKVAVVVLFNFGLFHSGLFDKAGYYLRERGQYTEAEMLLSRALSIRKQFFGAASLETASSLHDLALLYSVQSKYSQAEHLYQQALEIQEKIYGEHLFHLLGRPRPDIVDSLHNFAVLYIMQGKFEQAEPLLVRVQSIQEMELGTEHPDTIMSLINLAAFYIGQRKEEQAEVTVRRALSLWKTQLFCSDHYPYVDRSLLSLAVILHHDGKHEQADALYKHVLSVQKRLLGTTYPGTQQTKKDYMSFLRSMGRDAEAAALEANDEPSV